LTKQTNLGHDETDVVWKIRQCITTQVAETARGAISLQQQQHNLLTKASFIVVEAVRALPIPFIPLAYCRNPLNNWTSIRISTFFPPCIRTGIISANSTILDTIHKEGPDDDDDDVSTEYSLSVVSAYDAIVSATHKNKDSVRHQPSQL
jgi:hypothetical protein